MQLFKFLKKKPKKEKEQQFKLQLPTNQEMDLIELTIRRRKNIKTR